MVIRNLSKQYRVIRECGEPGAIAQYVCREEAEQKDCRIAVQNLKEVSGSEVRFLMEQINNGRFRDFIDFFTDSQNMYVVTAYFGEESLEKKLEEICSFRERMEIGKNILEYIVLSDLPPYFLRASMRGDLITVSRSLEIGLGYDLSNLEEFEKVTFQDGADRLGKILKTLYQEELSLRAFPPMEGLIYGLENGAYSSSLEVYGQFQEIYREWADKKREQMNPESLPFRIWNRIKQAGKFAKTAIAGAILVLAVGYLALSVKEFCKEPGKADNYSSIGTLKIRGQEEPVGEEPVQSEKTGE